MWELSKKFVFEAGHRLVKGYQGKCNHPHGHSWKVKITVFGDKLNGHDMLCDFKDIKVAAKPLIDELDHSFLVYKDDLVMATFLHTENFRVIEFDNNPTSEIIAKWLADEIQGRLPYGVLIKEILIDETCTSQCSYKPQYENF